MLPAATGLGVADFVSERSAKVLTGSAVPPTPLAAKMKMLGPVVDTAVEVEDARGMPKE